MYRLHPHHNPPFITLDGRRGVEIVDEGLIERIEQECELTRALSVLRLRASDNLVEAGK